MRSVLFGLLLMTTGVQAASLQLCPALPGTEGAGAEVVRPDGTRLRLLVDAKPRPGCQRLELPVGAGAIAAVHPVAPSVAHSLDARVLLQGPERDGQFTIGSVAGDGSAASPERPGPMPMLDNLLPAMKMRVFGLEERVQARNDGGRLRLQCRAGTRPAGVILTAPWYLSLARMALRAQSTATSRFDLSAADAAHAAKEAAVRLGTLEPGRRDDTIFMLPAEGFDRANWRSFSIACPPVAAELELADLRLVPQSSPPPPRAAWIWNAQDWGAEPDAVLAQALDKGMRTLFVSVPVSAGAVQEPERLAAFVRRARAAGVAVWTVDGDPRMVLPGEQGKAVARVRAYAAYNAAADPDARLAGMQFDVEHYLLPGYALSAQALDRHYVALARNLRGAAQGIPLEFVVPFWWADKADLMRGLAASASGVSVMNYRTDPAQIRQFAVPFLDWGAVHGKKVRIALEAGPVEVEQQRRYVRAAEGELWLVWVDQTPVLVLLKEAQRNPLGPAFRLESQSVFDGSATTFHRNPERLQELLPGLESVFAAWTSFAGMALHELK